MAKTKQPSQKYVCPICRTQFQRKPYNHEGSRTCEITAEWNRMRDITAEGKRHAAERGLRKVRTNVAQAIQRRKAAELCGLEELKTRVFSDPESDAEFELGTEWWAYDWVLSLWSYWNDIRNPSYKGTQNFYELLEDLVPMSEEERKLRIGMALLGRKELS